MDAIEHLFRICTSYSAATGLSEATISTRLFRDGKGLARIRAGGDIGARRLERAMQWFAANWPEGAEWPADVPRPDTPTLAPGAPDENDNPAAESLTPEECGA
ncbi:hypothetical protein [Ancylobacter sp. IITR112]|uniref:hypothetical protein n=1 Tax=Ancylobacter sp. IITR112 TaxID=3138073 RepID=UPI00352AAB16